MLKKLLLELLFKSHAGISVIFTSLWLDLKHKIIYFNRLHKNKCCCWLLHKPIDLHSQNRFAYIRLRALNVHSHCNSDSLCIFVCCFFWVLLIFVFPSSFVNNCKYYLIRIRLINLQFSQQMHIWLKIDIPYGKAFTKRLMSLMWTWMCMAKRSRMCIWSIEKMGIAVLTIIKFSSMWYQHW